MANFIIIIWAFSNINVDFRLTRSMLGVNVKRSRGKSLNEFTLKSSLFRLLKPLNNPELISFSRLDDKFNSSRQSRPVKNPSAGFDLHNRLELMFSVFKRRKWTNIDRFSSHFISFLDKFRCLRFGRWANTFELRLVRLLDDKSSLSKPVSYTHLTLPTICSV